MGKTAKPLPVKLIAGLIANDPVLFTSAKKILTKLFGKIDSESAIFDFNKTDYYEKEMGKDLKRLFLSFEGLMPAGRLVRCKLLTNAIEKKLSRGLKNRAINIDPGYVSLSKLILATTKNFAHRIYAGGGIFEEITLSFKDSTFQPGEWTYPDYRSADHIAFFNEIRKKYYLQIEKKYGLSQLYRCV